MWAGDALDVAKIAKERYCLQRLSQAHLIGQDTRNTVLV